jgi:hypothetical protein
MAPRLIAGNYDVIVLNEVFSDEAKHAFATSLSPHYPYYVHRLDFSPMLTSVYESGLMLFSKWPFTPVSSSCSTPCANIDGFANGAAVGRTWIGYSWFCSSKHWDFFANKGVGYVRLQSPTGKYYNVFFTHMQASYPDYDQCDGQCCYANWEATTAARTQQLATITSFQECIAPIPWATGAGDVYVLAGDLNINGDLSNVRFTGPTSEPSPTLSQNRYEYDHHFDITQAPDDPPNAHATFKSSLRDTWAQFMTPPQCAGHYFEEPFCPGTPYPGGRGKGDADYDRGFTYGAQDFSPEERLDYILLGSVPVTSPEPEHVPSFEMCAAHVTRAFNLWSVGAGEELGPGGISGARLGASPISDHIGLNAEVNRCHKYGSPFHRLHVDKNSKTVAALDYAGAAQWFLIQDRGTYTFKVVPTTNPAATMSYALYAPTELSIPLEGYHGEAQNAPAVPGHYTPEGQWVDGHPAFTGTKFVVDHSPFYIKVTGTEATAYDLYVHRNDCTSPEEACGIDPYDAREFPASARRTWEGLSSDDRYFEFHVARSDFQEHLEPAYQALSVYSAQEQDLIDVLEVLKEEGGVWVPVPTYEDTVSHQQGGLYVLDVGPSGPKPVHLDPLQSADARYLVHLHRSPAASSDGGIPATFDYWVGWETNLAWMFGVKLGGAPLTVECLDTQEVGHDEIWMAAFPDSFLSMVGAPCLGGCSNWEVSGHMKKGTPADWEMPWYASCDLNGWGEYYRDTLAYKFIQDIAIYLIEDDYGDCNDDERLVHHVYTSGIPKANRVTTQHVPMLFAEGVGYRVTINAAWTSHVQPCSYVGDPACQAPQACDALTRKCVPGN